MSINYDKRVVADSVEVCQNQHNLAAAEKIFHPDFVNHYDPEGARHWQHHGRPGASRHSTRCY